MKLQTLKARDVMTPNPIVLKETDSLAHAWHLFREHRISGAPVVDEFGELAGVLSQTDLVREAYQEAFEKLPRGFYFGEYPGSENNYWPVAPDRLHNTTVEEAMTAEVISCSVNDPVSTIAQKMRSNKIHRIVISEHEKPCGIISAFDLIQILEQQ